MVESGRVGKPKGGLGGEGGEGMPGQSCTSKQREVEMSKITTSVLCHGNSGIQLVPPGRDGAISSTSRSD